MAVANKNLDLLAKAADFFMTVVYAIVIIAWVIGVHITIKKLLLAAIYLVL